MARMISIKLDGQISFDEDGSVHMGVGMDAIWGKCCAEVGVVVRRSVVSLQSIEADGCPEAGVVVCHSVVGFSVIEADDGCPGAGDFRCHLVVDLGVVWSVPDVCSYASFGIAVHRVVGGVVDAVGSSG
jgi:hypothetical protein